MRRFTGILIAVVLTAGVLAGVSAPAEAKSYYFPEIDIDVTVRPDGSFEFREARSFAFDGDFTWAFYEVEKVKTAGIKSQSVIIVGDVLEKSGVSKLYGGSES